MLGSLPPGYSREGSRRPSFSHLALGSDLNDAASQPSIATYHSAVRVSWPEGPESPEAPPTAVSPCAASPWNTASEAAETGRQSQELLREMRRLRLQMSELERVAGSRSAAGTGARRSGSPASAAAAPSVVGTPAEGRFGGGMHGGSFGGQDRLGASGSSPASLGIGSSQLLNSCHGSAVAAVYAEPIATEAAAANGSQPAATTLMSGPSWPGARSALDTSLPEFAGWEYRAHPSGDPIDAAVATLVNQQGGRYRGWRALLCRLEQGVYLCGTRRVHIRADAERIEASDDGGRTWADLEDLARGAEASQHALLERARGAAGRVV